MYILWTVSTALKHTLSVPTVGHLHRSEPVVQKIITINNDKKNGTER